MGKLSGDYEPELTKQELLAEIEKGFKRLDALIDYKEVVVVNGKSFPCDVYGRPIPPPPIKTNRKKKNAKSKARNRRSNRNTSR